MAWRYAYLIAGRHEGEEPIILPFWSESAPTCYHFPVDRKNIM